VITIIKGKTMQKSGDHCPPDEMSGHILVITDIQVKFQGKFL